MIKIDQAVIDKVGQGRVKRYEVKVDGDKVSIWSADLNDSIDLSAKDVQFQAKVRAVGYLIDQKLKLKGQHQSRLWSAVRKAIA